jgi:hypothetical protein
MTWLLPLLKHRATWGVAIALGVLVAITAHGRLKYREGYGAGFVARAVDAHADALTAKAISDSAWAVLYAQAASARDAERAALAKVARAEARTRAATARLDDALAAYRVDTVSHTPACSEMADACAVAAALWAQERDTLAQLIAAQDTVVLRQSELLAEEPSRLQSAVRVALEQQRRTFRGPSRVTWASVGALLGTIVTLGLVR